MSNKTVYEKIMRAYHRGTGTALSAEEVWVLGEDYAISSQAADAEEARDLEAERERNANKPQVVQPIVRKRCIRPDCKPFPAPDCVECNR